MNPGLAGISPELRTSAFYLLLYANAGTAVTYGGQWFRAQGLSDAQIGLINSVPILAMLLLNLVVGRLADRASDWRVAIIAASVLAGVLPAGLFLVSGFPMIFAVWLVASLAVMAIPPTLDAATMRMARRRGSDYSRIRAWGSIGFLAVILLSGYLIERLGPGAYLPLFVGFAVLRGLVALGLPQFRGGEGDRQAAPAPQRGGATSLRQMLRPWFLLPLVGWAMVYGTHMVLSAFQALLWTAQGIPVMTIGVLIGLGALSEVVVFFFARFLPIHWPARYLMLASGLLSVARWVVMAFSPDVPVLFFLQSLHGITFALGFLACINFVANWTSEDIAAEAQGFFVMLQQAGSVVAVMAFGWLTAAAGAWAYLGSALFALAGCLMIWGSLRLKAPHPASGPLPTPEEAVPASTPVAGL